MRFIDETPRAPTRTRFEAMAEKKLDVHWVALVAFEAVVPRKFGDNVGIWPVHVELAADWRATGKVFDRNQPSARAVRLAVMGVQGRPRAMALKAAFDEALGGREKEADADPLRHRHRNLVAEGGPEGFEAWWAPLIEDALLRCSAAVVDLEDLMGPADYEHAVARKAAEIMAQAQARAAEGVR
ncbi:MAG: hypothetical protein AAFZ09_16300 [Pseudomonadota bacterium]